MALEASVREAMARKLAEMKPEMDEAVAWIEAVTGDKMEGSFGSEQSQCLACASRGRCRRMAAIGRGPV